MSKCESEVKRLQAISNQKKEFERKQQIIRNALKEVDKKQTNKIIFDSDEEPEPKKKKKDKPVLFDSDDEDIELTGHEFDNKPKINGELIKLQSKYGNDERFVLDKRFAENNEESEENEQKEVEEEIDEKAFNFKILENVLGKPIISKPVEPINKERISEKKFKPMVRYDPEDESHGKYEVKPEKKEPKKKKDKKVKLPEDEEKNEPPPVSNEIFYSVSENLTQSLKKEEGFSLLKMFGRNEEDDKKENNSNSVSVEIDKNDQFNSGRRNPFKYDSSDDENEDLNKEYSLKEESTPSFPNEDNFFFDLDDPRLLVLTKEEFLRPLKEEEVQFNARRQELKRIVRKKIQNIQRENGKWKMNKSWKGHEKRKKH